jgi:hypothetical protein
MKKLPGCSEQLPQNKLFSVFFLYNRTTLGSRAVFLYKFIANRKLNMLFFY